MANPWVKALGSKKKASPFAAKVQAKKTSPKSNGEVIDSTAIELPPAPQIEQQTGRKPSPFKARVEQAKAQAPPAPEPKSPFGKRVAERRAKLNAESDTRDRVMDGVKIHTVRPVGSYWTIDVTNGDVTTTFHNRYGSWLTSGEGDNLKEPKQWLAFALQDRLVTELARRKPQKEEPAPKRPKADHRGGSGTTPPATKSKSTKETTTQKPARTSLTQRMRHA